MTCPKHEIPMIVREVSFVPYASEEMWVCLKCEEERPKRTKAQVILF